MNFELLILFLTQDLLLLSLSSTQVKKYNVRNDMYQGHNRDMNVWDWANALSTLQGRAISLLTGDVDVCLKIMISTLSVVT